eukprot:gene9520-19786_t
MSLKFIALLLICCCRRFQTYSYIDPNNIVVSIAIDADNLEVQFEAIRLLKSREMFGGTLRYSKLAVCISHSGEFTNLDLLAKLSPFNVTSISYSQRFSLPEFSPTLNKICSFNPPCMDSNDYLLYLDADIFIASDPIPLLTKYYNNNNSDILCGRPWKSHLELHDFPYFLDEYSSSSSIEKPPLATINGGFTLYGMCNTGMYFMSTSTANNIYNKSLHFLNKSIQNRDITGTDNVHSIFSPANFMIDSIILWAAQYALNSSVTIVNPLLNYMVAAEDYIVRFIKNPDVDSDIDSDIDIDSDTQTEEDINNTAAANIGGHSSNNNDDNDRGRGSDNDIDSDSNRQNMIDEQRHRHSPSLVHFSTGSSLTFKTTRSNNSNSMKISQQQQQQQSQHAEEEDDGGGVSESVSLSSDGVVVVQTEVEVLTTVEGTVEQCYLSLTAQLAPGDTSLLRQWVLPDLQRHCWDFYDSLKSFE